ncbi:MAG: transporter substrate-binding domain-containing protein [Candidatus Wallbacteria bacterium]
MKFKNHLLALCMAGLFLVPAVQNSNAQTAEVSTQEGIAKTAEVSVSGGAVKTDENSISKNPIELTEKKDMTFLNGKSGVVTPGRLSEETFKNVINSALKCKIEKFTFNDTISGCLSMLKSDRVDFMMTTDVAAIYIAQRNPDMKVVIYPGQIDVVMVLRNSDSALKDSINAAIKQLKANGTLAELEKKWIKELPVGQEPSMSKIEKVSDTAETIFVGVSGTMPPLDYIASNGKPAGYNIAMLTEISKVTGKNIEVISIDSQSEFTALAAKKIDVFFWGCKPVNKSIAEDLKKTSDQQNYDRNFTMTDPYYSVKEGFLLKK